MDILRAVTRPELKEEIGYKKLVIFSTMAKFTFESMDPTAVQDAGGKVEAFAAGHGVAASAVRAEQTFEKRDGTRVVKVELFFNAMQL